ncbi:MAG: hypothetical protein ACK5RL_05795 [Acidimicrobiales bacterium]
MGSETLLRSACELSYAVARSGLEATPSIEPPATMRSFLYVSELPSRALTVAQEAIEEDPSFRRRVAEEADEADIGRAGYLWLHRPIGWAAEFEEIVNSSNGQSDHRSNDGDVVTAVPAFGSGNTDFTGTANGSTNGSGDRFWTDTDRRPDADRGRDEADAIEDELSSLRGLVERLSNERKSVTSSARPPTTDLEGTQPTSSSFPARPADTDLAKVQAALDAAHSELDQARSERDHAVRQHSEALTRQLDLEKELGRSRQLRIEVEQEHAEVDARLVEVQEALSRAEKARGEAEVRGDELTNQLKAARSAQEELRAEAGRANDDHAHRYQALEATFTATRTEGDKLRSEKTALADQVSTLEVEVSDLRQRKTEVEAQAAEAQALVDALTEEKIDLASRLADTEAMLETTRTQINAVKSDAENIAAELATVRNQRSDLSSQVDELHGSLTEALGDLAAVRSQSDRDRAELKSVRGERDQLRVRSATLEDSQTTLDAKVKQLTQELDATTTRADTARNDVAERDSQIGELALRRDQLITELSEVKSSLDSTTTERDDLSATHTTLSARSAELEAERDRLLQQVSQLSEENSGIQAQLVESDRLRVETAESQGHALSELAHRLAMVENERNRFERDLRTAEDRLIEAMTAFDAANKSAADQVRRDLGTDLLDTTAPETTRESAGDTAEETKGDAAKGSEGDIAEDSAGDTAKGSKGGAAKGSKGDTASTGPVPLTTANGTAEAGNSNGADPYGDLVDPEAMDAEVAATLPDGPKVDTEPDAEADEEKTDGAGAAGDTVIRGKAVGDNLVTDKPLGDDTGRPGGRDTSGGTPREVTKPSGFRPARTADGDLPRDARVGDRVPASPATDDTVDHPAAEVPSSATEDETTDSGQDTDGVSESPLAAGAAALAAMTPAEVVERPPESGRDGLAPGRLTDPAADSRGSRSEDGADPATGRASKRWNFGALGRSRGDDAPADPEPAGSANGLAPDEANDISDAEIDDISSELSQALATASDAADESNDLDLDAIGDLISQTVTDFDPSSIPQPGFADAPVETPADDPYDTPSRRAARNAPPSVFSDLDAAVGLADGRPARRQIDIPADLHHDEVELARHVVSSPDVVLLVDGDSVAKLGWPSLPVAQQRDALVSYLGDLADSTGVAPDVVFDGRIGDEDGLPASESVRIRLSTPPTEPAAALDELIDAYPEQWPIAIVTDDTDLGQTAVSRGATVLNNGQLLDLFIAQ